MKKCCKCQETKPNTDFNKNAARKDGLNTICRACGRQRSRKYYQENRTLHLKNVSRRKKATLETSRRLVYNYLLQNPCKDCGEKDPIVLEFDHQRDKKHIISKMVNEGYSTDTLKREIEKCEVRCSNCHRRKTARDFGYYCFRFAQE